MNNDIINIGENNEETIQIRSFNFYTSTSIRSNITNLSRVQLASPCTAGVTVTCCHNAHCNRH